MCAPECLKFSPAPERHVTLVARVRRRIERDRLVPEYSQHLHPLSVVPDGACDDAPGTGHTNHFVQRFGPIGDEIQHEKRERPVEAPIEKPKVLGIADLEPDQIPWMTPLGEGDIRCGGINANDVTGRGNCGDSRRQCPGSRSDIKDGIAVANSGKFDHERGEGPTPSAHEPLVLVAR
jgi:hypothetical protein